MTNERSASWMDMEILDCRDNEDVEVVQMSDHLQEIRALHNNALRAIAEYELGDCAGMVEAIHACEGVVDATPWLIGEVERLRRIEAAAWELLAADDMLRSAKPRTVDISLAIDRARAARDALRDALQEGKK